MSYLSHKYFKLRTPEVQNLLKGKTNYLDRWGLIWLVLFMTTFIWVSLKFTKLNFNYNRPAKIEISMPRSSSSDTHYLSGNALILKDKLINDGLLTDIFLKIKGNTNGAFLKCNILSIAKLEKGEYYKIIFECSSAPKDLNPEFIDNNNIYFHKSISLFEFAFKIIDKK